MAGMQSGVRLNATSDLPWERRKVTIDGREQLLMDFFPEAQFYDYTKVTKRALAHARGEMPENYHLTFSKTEDNDDDCVKVLEAGGNITAVCSKEVHKEAVTTGHLPYPYHGPQVVDGDEHDFRPADPAGGVVVALKAKGDAKRDTSGFVMR